MTTEEGSMELQSDALNAAIGKVLHAVADEEARPILTCILIEGTVDGLRLVAADNYRIAVADVIDADATAFGNVNLPASEVPVLRAFLAKRKRTVIAEWKDTTLVVSDPSGSVSLRLMDGQYPNYRSLFATQPARTTVVINAAYLLDAMKALAKSGATSFELPVVTGTAGFGDTVLVSAAGYSELIMPIRAELSGVEFGATALRDAA